MKCAPPENVKDMISQAYILCNNCNRSLLDQSARVYKCSECNTFICKDCKSEHKSLEGDHTVEICKDFKNPEETMTEEKQKK